MRSTARSKKSTKTSRLFVVRRTVITAACCSALLVADFNHISSTSAEELEPELEGPEVPEGFGVTKPGLVMVDADERRAFLEGLDKERLFRWCGPAISGWPRHGVAKNVTSEKQVGDTLAWTMMLSGARMLGFDDEDAVKAVRRNLLRWAKDEALTEFEDPENASMYYNLNRTLLPIIVNYAIVRNHPAFDEEDRQRIERWLGEIVWRRGPQRFYDTDNQSSRNNHRYVSASVNMAWGALMGVDPLFQDGMRALLLALEDMNPDGSLPEEMERGDRALHYQRHAVMSLVAIAEMAAIQGYNLYALRGPEGQSIHRAVEFLADSLEDPRVLNARFETEGFEIEDPQDLHFLVQRGHDRHYMAWLEPYRARFPDKESVHKIETVMAALGEPERPLTDDFSGANTTCLFAVPNADDPWETANQ